MDNVDRMYRHLVRTIRTKFPQYLSQPFDVAVLHQTILPYRLHRRELGLETNDDYEITLSQLLTGERGYLIVDDRMRDTLARELATPNPDPSAFKQFATSTVALSPAALRSLEAGPDDPTTPLRPIAVPATQSFAGSSTGTMAAPIGPPPPIAPLTAPPPAPVPPAESVSAPTSAPFPSSAPSALPPETSERRTPPPQRTSTPAIAPSGARAIVPEPGERCTSCNETLPPGKPITFCPHCGHNLTTMNCQACGSELELGWKFCPVCGRPANTG